MIAKSGPDPRFFNFKKPLSLAQVKKLGGVSCVIGLDNDDDTIEISQAFPLNSAEPGSLSFFEDKSLSESLKTTKARFVFLTQDTLSNLPPNCIGLIVKFPQAAYARVCTELYKLKDHEGHESRHKSVHCESDVTIGPMVVLGQDVEIGEGTVIEAHVVIGPGVRIGRHCHIGAHVSLKACYLGDRVKISAGTRIGESGFGVRWDDKGLIDVPQLGRVIIQDDVSIGANSCIDRGAYEDTFVGEMTKIDNQVQIAHNVHLGRKVLIAAQAGIAGSVRVGDGTMFGGRAGVVDHLTIGAHARIGAAAVVLKSVDDSQTVTGFPAKPMRQFLRESLWLEKQAQTKDKPR